MASKTEWYKDNFFISTNKSLLQAGAVNDAYASDLLYWTKRLDESVVQKILDNSLCFGVYALPSSSSDIAGRGNPRQIGLARLITDQVTTAYLSDVYILKEFQGKGLGTWLMQCVNEVMGSWPDLRRVLLITSDGEKFYEEKLGLKVMEQGKGGFNIMSRRGPGSPMTF